VDFATTAYLGALLAGDWDSVAGSAQAVQRSASGLVSAFATWHIERGLRSLAHVER
jgi:DNA repair protein RecO (recombination protein O)